MAAAITVQQQRSEQLLCSGNPEQPWITYFKEQGRVADLTRENAVRFLERVLIFDGGHIEIIFRHQEQFELALQFLALQQENQQLLEVV